MKKLLAITAAAALLAMAGTAMAATANLTVTASVIDACTVTAGTLSFGNLDPATAGAVSVTQAPISIICTKGNDYTLAADKGVNVVGTQAYLKNTTNADTIPYSLSLPGSGTGTGTVQTPPVTGDIAANTYNTASFGTYNDTVLITVTP